MSEQERQHHPGLSEQGPIQRIVPALWFDDCAPQAVEFYTGAFARALAHDAQALAGTGVAATSHYPVRDLADGQARMAGKVLEIRFRLAGLELSAINAGPQHRPNPAISLMVHLDPQAHPDAGAHLDALWEALAAEGRVLMPVGRYPFSERFGWVEDRYGVSWQLLLGPAGRAATASELGRAEEAAPSGLGRRPGPGARGRGLRLAQGPLRHLLDHHPGAHDRAHRTARGLAGHDHHEEAHPGRLPLSRAPPSLRPDGARAPPSGRLRRFSR